MGWEPTLRGMGVWETPLWEMGDPSDGEGGDRRPPYERWGGWEPPYGGWGVGDPSDGEGGGRPLCGRWGVGAPSVENEGWETPLWGWETPVWVGSPPCGGWGWVGDPLVGGRGG